MKQKKSTVLAAWLLTVLLAGCTVPQADAGAESGAANVAETAAESGGTAEAQAGADGATGGVIGPVIEENLTFKGKDEYSDYAGAVEIDLSAPQAADGVSVSGSTVTISAAGTYVLTGTLADGQVVVAAGENDDVRLVLENASISSASTAPVYVKSADKVILSLPEGTESYVADAVTGTDGEDTLTGAIYAACDLSINGSGTLRIEAGANDAISTKDDLRITGGTLEITAADDGLVANDGILIRGGTLRITAGGDGIKATKAEADKGFVYIGGGSVSIDADCDGIQAETSVLVSGGALEITAGGGVNTQAETGNAMFGGAAEESDTVSMKGIKAEAALAVTGGTLTLDAADDSLHSNGTASVSGGTITARTGDDGIHADDTLTISGGEITVAESYEGVEAGVILVTGGTIDVTASDDGFNAAGGTDSSAENGRFGPDTFAGDATKSMTFEGGTVTVNAGGDGLDSNGTLTVSGGTILVSGPTDSANGIFDSGTSFTVNGGVLLGTGSAGMLETPGEDSAQNTLCAACSGSAGSAVEIRDADGSVLAAYTAPKAFSVVVCSAPEITQGETYTIFVDGAQAAQVECTGVVSGDISGMGGFGGQPDMNGGAQNGGPGAGQAPGMRGGFSDR